MNPIQIDPQIMSGAPCFAGTRVPVRTLIDYLEGGYSIDEFLDHFPGVTRELAIAYLGQISAPRTPDNARAVR